MADSDGEDITAPHEGAGTSGAPASGAEEGSSAGSRSAAWSAVYTVAASDPHGELIDQSQLSAEDLAQIDELMRALAHLRSAETALSEASRQYMKLNETDMRALHFLIVCANQGTVATPGAIAAQLGISSASTTKLLDRLQKGGHIRREPHPSDRRALAIQIRPETRNAAMRTVGAQHAGRFRAAQRLSAHERAVVIGFLEDMASELSLDGVEWGEAQA